jgi:EmrB/QacA subfamily drug resistance transporter
MQRATNLHTHGNGNGSAPRAKGSARRQVHPAVALMVIAGAQLMVVLDVTIVNVALPHIQAGLGFSRTGLAWVIDAYTLAFGGLLLLGGRAGDILGRRRMFMVGVVLFAGASLLGGFATSTAWLVAVRAAQGVGAAIAAPTGLALLTTTFPEGPERNRAFGIWAAVAGAGGAVGLILGGVLTDLLSWRWVLFVNAPIGALLALAAPVVLPESERNPGRFDLPGAVTATLGVGSLVYGFINAASNGWNDTGTLASLVAAAVLLASFVAIESRSRQPLLPLHLFAERSRWGSYAVMLSAGAAMFGVLFFLTQFLQGVLGYSPLKTGLAFLPFTPILVVTAQVASRVLRRTGPRALILPGTVLVAGGLLWLSRLGVNSGYATLLLPGIAMIAVGMGLIFVPVALTAVAGVERRDSGVASATLNVSQQIGGTLGLAALVTVAATATSHQVSAAAGAGLTAAAHAHLVSQALVHGWSVGFALAAAFAGAAFLSALLVLRPHRPGVAVEEELEVGPLERGSPVVIGSSPHETQGRSR